MILGICIMVAIVVAADAVFIRARIRLRTRAEHHARRPSRGLGPEGWRKIEDLDGGDEGSAVEDIPCSRLGSILGRQRSARPMTKHRLTCLHEAFHVVAARVQGVVTRTVEVAPPGEVLEGTRA